MNKKNFSKWVVLTVVVWMTLVAGVSCNQQKKSDNVEEEATEDEVTEEQLEALADVMSKYSIVNAFSDGLAVVSDKTTNLWGAINKEGEEVIPCTFQYIAEAFHEGVAIAVKNSDADHGVVIDKEGHILFTLEYEYCGQQFHDGLLAICKTYDTMDYSDLPMVGDIMSFGKLGFIDKTGKMVIAPDTYDVPLGEGPIISEFSNGLCKVWKNGHPIYIDVTGKELDDPQVGIDSKFSEGRAFEMKDGKLGLVDDKGNELTPFQFEIITLYEDTEGEEPLIGSFHEGLAWAAKDGLFGYIDREGKTVIPFRYEPGYESGCGWYNQQPTFDFHQGVARVWDKESGKFGFIDKDGNEVSPCRFDEATDISEGLATVKIGDDWGFMDTKGNCTIHQ